MQKFYADYPHLLDMMCDPSGNYLVQGYLDEGLANYEQGGVCILANVATIILLNGNGLQLSCHEFGCRVVQRVLEVAAMMRVHVGVGVPPANFGPELCAQLCSNASDAFLLPAFNDHANHVITKCFQCIPPNAIPLHFLHCVNVGVLELSLDRNGCRVVKAAIRALHRGDAVDESKPYPEPSNNDQLKLCMLYTLHGHLHDLIEHEYGNYVVQQLVESVPR